MALVIVVRKVLLEPVQRKARGSSETPSPSVSAKEPDALASYTIWLYGVEV